MISPQPDIRTLEIDPDKDSWMILACDGIWNFMSSQEVVDYIQHKIHVTPHNKLSSICEEVSPHRVLPSPLMSNIPFFCFSCSSIAWLPTPWATGLGATT